MQPIDRDQKNMLDPVSLGRCQRPRRHDGAQARHKQNNKQESPHHGTTSSSSGPPCGSARITASLSHVGTDLVNDRWRSGAMRLRIARLMRVSANPELFEQRAPLRVVLVVADSTRD